MSLRDDLIARIATGGPITVAEFMAEALLHPTYGYYATRDPIGAAGDFITAPEISQMFGELIGLCLAQSWLDQGAPSPFTLAELGPGRGTLMADILRATQAVPGFHAAAQIDLVEASIPLRSRQAGTLTNADVSWHDTIDTLPDQPLWLVANEFFDALPVRQFQRNADLWRERCVGTKGGDLVFGLAPPAPQSALDDRIEDTQEGDIVETCHPGTAIMSQIGLRIATHGGAALIIDYGDWHSLGDTLQALRGHAPANPLANPGLADLTTHVDFEALALHANPALYSRLTPQGVFLERLGITARAQQLTKRLDGLALDNHIAAHRRLTHPEEMGNLFKVLGVFPASSAPPPGVSQ